MKETKKIEYLILPQGFTMYGSGISYEQIKAEAERRGIDAVRYEEVTVDHERAG